VEMDKVLEALVIGFIGIIFFLYWINLSLSRTHQEISKVRKLLISIADSTHNNKDNVQHIGSTKSNIKWNLPRLIREKLNKHNNYEISED
jgi:hypothetical protein